MPAKHLAIGGQARSGTTLIASLVAASPEVAMFPGEIAPHRDFRYTNLPDNSLGLRLLVKRLLGHTHAADSSDCFIAAIRSSDKSLDTVGSIFFYLLAWWRRQADCPAWAFKSPGLEDSGDFLLKHSDDIHMICMVRDPRDVAVSVVSRWWWQRSAVRLARKWRHSVNRAIRLQRDYGNRVRIVRYEAVVSDPDSVLAEVRAWLSISGPSLQDHLVRYRNAEHGKTAFRFSGENSSFDDVRPGQISNAPIGRYKQSLSQADQYIIRWLAGRGMRDFDYKKDQVGDRLAPKLNAASKIVVETPIWLIYELMFKLLCGLGLQYPANDFKKVILRNVGKYRCVRKNT